MGYCTVAEVRAAIDFPDAGAPIDDAAIAEFIIDSEEEIENIYKTKFGNVDEISTATSGTTTTLVDSGASYTADQYVGHVVWIIGGTNSGEYREITTNDTTTLTVSPAFTAAIDNTSIFRVTKLGYIDETIDGSGLAFQFTVSQPLIKLNSLTIDSTAVTTSSVYQTQASGKIELGVDSEMSYFVKTYPQLINMKYVYGVYPMPRIIKRLCVLISAMRTLMAQIAGTYDDFANVSLPGGIQASKGEPYLNIQASLNYMQGETRGIIYGFTGEQVSADFRGIPSYRPFVNFG